MGVLAALVSIVGFLTGKSLIGGISGILALVMGVLSWISSNRHEKLLNEVINRTLPRAFTEDQLNHLSQGLRSSTQKLPIEIATMGHCPPNTDACELGAKQLKRIFSEAGWQVSFIQAQDVLQRGIRINAFLSMADTDRFVRPLLEVFGSLQPVVFVPPSAPAGPEKSIRITVGLDPRLYSIR